MLVARALSRPIKHAKTSSKSEIFIRRSAGCCSYLIYARAIGPGRRRCLAYRPTSVRIIYRAPRNSRVIPRIVCNLHQSIDYPPSTVIPLICAPVRRRVLRGNHFSVVSPPRFVRPEIRSFFGKLQMVARARRLRAARNESEAAFPAYPPPPLPTHLPRI